MAGSVSAKTSSCSPAPRPASKLDKARELGVEVRRRGGSRAADLESAGERPMGAVIFLVDDDDGSREAMARALERVGYTMRAFAVGRGGARAAATPATTVDVVVSDVRMPGMDGYELLRQVRAERPELPFLLVTAYGDVEDAVAALQEGADDYLTKPVKMQELRKRVQLHLERRVAERREPPAPAAARQDVRLRGHRRPLAGHGGALRAARVVAPTRSTVLHRGRVRDRQGAGGQRPAPELGPRATGPFMAVNCGAIPGEILESELFGHERGAFTGAHQRRIGLIESASGGTLFLDEISELSPDLQVKLLRVLEERTVVRGSAATSRSPVDFRLVAATNRESRDIGSREGRFRQDLYYRLKVVTLEIPPCEQRAEDIPLFVQHFLKVFNKELGRRCAGRPSVGAGGPEASSLARQRARAAQPHRNLVLFAEGEEITLEDLPADTACRPCAATRSDSGVAAAPDGRHREEAILRTLEYTDGHRARAATLLEIGLADPAA